MVRAGIIGLGNMGGRMVRRLLDGGAEVGIYDVNQEAIEAMVKLGAEKAGSPADLARKFQYIITVLPNVYIVQETLQGNNGLMKGMNGESLLIEMTTSIPSVTKELSAMMSGKGLRMIDAPVSGGVKKAENGSLSIMVGGEEADYKEALPILEMLGENINHVGASGAGHTIKALNNMISATTLAATGEAMALGVKLGLDPAKMLDVINTSTGRSFSSDFKFPNQVLTRNFEVGFTLDLMVKDLKIAMSMAEQESVPMFISGASFQLWKKAWTEGRGSEDHTAIIKSIEEMFNVEIKG